MPLPVQGFPVASSNLVTSAPGVLWKHEIVNAACDPNGSGRFWGVPAYAGVGSGGRFGKLLEGSGKFRRVPVCAAIGRRVSEGFLAREFRCALVRVGSGGFGRFRRVPVWFVALQP